MASLTSSEKDALREIDCYSVHKYNIPVIATIVTFIASFLVSACLLLLYDMI